MHPRATADPSTETYSKQAKVDMPYTPDNFLRNLVLYARSPSKVSVHWTPFQKTTKLELTTRLVYEKQLHVVPVTHVPDGGLLLRGRLRDQP
ncbi:hypothetical protein MTO96_051567 [Rhipicephalus appendiculatus]